MSFIVDKRIEDYHTREDCGSVWNLSWSLFKKYLLSKFPIDDIKRFAFK